MVKKAALLLLSALFVLTAAACGSGASANVTTQEGLEATEDADGPDSEAAAMANYYGSLSFSDLVTEELLSQLITNRVPFKYDQLYADTPATVESVAFETPEDGEAGCDFVVTLTVGGETETRTGAIRWEEDTALISSFWEAG